MSLEHPVALSIVIPTRNEAENIALLLASLRALTAENPRVECIVVDGGSDDTTVAIAARHGCRVLESSPGRAPQMNTGAQACQGGLIWFLHADSQLPPSAIQTLLEFEGIAGEQHSTFWGRFDTQLSGQQRAFRLIERGMNWRSRLTGICTGDQGIFVSRSLFFRAGGFPHQALMEDIELSKRLKAFARPQCLEQRLTTSSRYWEENGIVRTVLRMWALRLAYWLGTSPETLHRLYYRHKQIST